MADYPSITISWRGYREGPPNYRTIRTAFESGHVQTRNKSTTAPRRFQFMHEAASPADVATFLTFWNARKGGAEVFNFTDPRSTTIVPCKFVGDEPPEIVPLGGGNTAFTIGPVQLEEAL